MAKIKFDQHWWPTTVDAGDGKFHPAIESAAGGIRYCPNISDTKEKAYACAALLLKDALDAAEAIARKWSLTRPYAIHLSLEMQKFWVLRKSGPIKL